MDILDTDFQKVRGGGNILQKHTLEDYELYDEAVVELTSSTTTINNRSESVFSLCIPHGRPYSISLVADKDSYEVFEKITLTATVEDYYGDPVESALLTFKLAGDDVYGYTNSNGVVNVAYTPDTTGDYTYWCTWKYLRSDPVNVTVSKGTTALSITGGGTYDLGDTVTISGVLSCHGQGVGSVSVGLFKNGIRVDTVTTGSDGSYSFSFTASDEGTATYGVGFLGNDYFKWRNSETVHVTVTTPQTVDSVSLATNKNILSQYDSETATLTATVFDNNSSPVEGVTVTFYKGTTSIGTGTTDSSGQATCSYSATGAGALSFEATCESVDSSTVNIQDCYLYDPLTTDKSRYTKTQGNGTLTYESTGLTIQGTTSSDTYFYSPNDYLPSGDYTVEFTWLDYNNGWSTGFGLEDFFFEQDTSDGIVFKVTGQSDTYIHNITVPKGSVMKLEVTGTTTKTIKVYYGSTLITTLSNVNRTRKQFFKTYNGRIMKLCDLKIY